MIPRGSKNKEKHIITVIVMSCIVIISIVVLAASKYASNNASVTTFIVNSPTSASSDTSEYDRMEIEDTTASATDTDVISGAEAPSEPLYININTASKDELMELNGIGSVIADEIISYRSNNGGFRNIEEIMKVKGIGKVTFSDISEFIYVDFPTYEEPESSEEFAENTTTESKPVVTERETEAETTTTECTMEHVLTLEECAPINLNTASVEELILLPHIDEENALRIIDIRERIGGYSHIYEILLIDTITQAQAAEILPYICVGSEEESENE